MAYNVTYVTLALLPSSIFPVLLLETLAVQNCHDQAANLLAGGLYVTKGI